MLELVETLDLEEALEACEEEGLGGGIATLEAAKQALRSYYGGDTAPAPAAAASPPQPSVPRTQSVFDMIATLTHEEAIEVCVEDSVLSAAEAERMSLSQLRSALRQHELNRNAPPALQQEAPPADSDEEEAQEGALDGWSAPTKRRARSNTMLELVSSLDFEEALEACAEEGLDPVRPSTMRRNCVIGRRRRCPLPRASPPPSRSSAAIPLASSLRPQDWLNARRTRTGRQPRIGAVGAA